MESRTVLLVGFPRQFGLSWRTFGPGRRPSLKAHPKRAGPSRDTASRRGRFVERSRTEARAMLAVVLSGFALFSAGIFLVALD
jgi:hypothetical protein